MIKRIPVDALKCGMYITDMNNDWIPHNKERRAGFIRKDETIERIARMGVEYVYVDTAKGIDSQDGEPAADVEARTESMLQEVINEAPSGTNSTSLDIELERARRVHGEAQSLVNTLLSDVKSGRAIDLEPFQNLAGELSTSIFSNPNALSALGRIREKDNYLLEHSVNLSVLISIFGKGLSFDSATLQELITGALLHDIGKVLTPDEILQKPGKLTSGEFEIMKEHVTHSRNILMESEGVGTLSLLTAAQHHERLDGTGYPDGLTGDEISLYGRMAAIADVYDAITADRVYHKGITPTQGLRKLIEWSGDHLDGDLVRQFIRFLGIYPVGSTVLLESGKLAVVIETNPDDQRLPIVRTFYHTRFRQHITAERLELSDRRVQDRIESAVDPAHYGFEIKKFLA